MSALLQKNLRRGLWYKAFLTSNISSAYFMVYLLFERDLLPAQATMLTAIELTAKGLLEVPSGHFADRWGRKPSMILGCSLATVGIFLYTAHSLPLLVAGAVFTAAGSCFALGADSALACDNCVVEGQTQAYDEFEARAARNICIATTLGSLLAIGLVWQIGLVAPLWAKAGSFAAALITACSIKENTVLLHRKTAPVVSLRKTIVGMGSRHQLLMVFGFGAGCVVLVESIVLLSPLYYTQVQFNGKPLPVQWIGWTWVVYQAAAWGTGQCLRRFAKRIERKKTLIATTLFSGICYVLMATQHSVLGLVIIIGVYAVPQFQFPALAHYVRKLSQPHERATVISTQRFIAFVASGLWTIGTAWVIGRHGTTSIMLLNGAVGGILAAGVLAHLLATRRRRHA